MKKLFCLFLLSLHGLDFYAQLPPLVQWQRALGGIQDDEFYCIIPSLNGKYVALGNTKSNTGNVSGNHGQMDAWVVGLDSIGGIQWSHAYGGTAYESFFAGASLSDSGYVLVGNTASHDGDVSGPNHGSLTDIWAICIDAMGDLLWQRKLGSFLNDEARDIYSKPDGSVVIVGNVATDGPFPDGDITGGHGSFDYWLSRLSGTGILEWQRTFGGSGIDVAFTVQPTYDAGSIIAGLSTSNDGDVNGAHGSDDCWVVKVDSLGNLQWQKALGGSSDDMAFDVRQTTDGSYIVAGKTSSQDGDVTGNHGGNDAWVVKLDGTGGLLWQKTLGGTDDDGANSIEQTADGGYIVSGATASIAGDVTGNHGGYDAWVVKLDSAGSLVWQKCLGGSEGEQASCIRPTTDGGYIFAGNTESNDGDVVGNHGGRDAWVVKLGAEQFIGIQEQSVVAGLEVFPVPTRGPVNVRLNIGQGSTFRMEVLDATGQVVLVPFLTKAAPGPRQLWQFDAAPLAPGAYLLRLLLDGKAYTGRLVKE